SPLHQPTKARHSWLHIRSHAALGRKWRAASPGHSFCEEVANKESASLEPQEAHAMRTKSNFWVVLHQLVAELQPAGSTVEDQSQQLVEHRQNQPAILRTVNCANLEYVAGIVKRLVGECKDSA